MADDTRFGAANSEKAYQTYMVWKLRPNTTDGKIGHQF